MAFKIIALTLATLMLVWPQLFARWSQRRHAERLDALRAGGEEQFFEERRSLETYPPHSKPNMWRFLGGALALVILANLFLRS
jgi:hypothetical protein